MEFFRPEEILNHLNTQDIKRYYSRCVLPFKDKLTGEVAFYYIVDADKNVFHAIREDGESIIRRFSEFYMPMGFNFKGFLNFGEFTAYISRNTRRQWRKGLSKENTEVYIPRSDIVYKFFNKGDKYREVKEARKFLILPLTEYYNNTKIYYPLYSEAYNKVISGKACSVAVSPEYALTLSEGCSTPVLLKSNITVGRGFADHVTLRKTHGHLWPQINFTEVRGEQ